MLDKTDFSTEMRPPDDMQVSRELPHNILAEQELLGAILINNEALDAVSGFLKSEHFFDPLHGRIFKAAQRRIQAGHKTTPVTLKSVFENEEPLNEITVPQYLGRLAASATSITNAKAYGHDIFEMFRRREFIRIGDTMINDGFQTDNDVGCEVLIEEVEDELFNLAENSKYGSGFRTLDEALKDSIEMANNAYMRNGGLAGNSTGFKDLDRQVGGLQKSDLIVLAGRPSMGKTALATNIALNTAKIFKREHADKQNGGAPLKAVGFFSLEMSDEQLATRMLSSFTKIPSEEVRRGVISEHSFKRLVDGARNMNGLPLHIDQTGGLSIGQLAARARRLKRQKNIEVIIIDYIQLLSGGKSKGQGRTQEVTEITVGLKALAKELDVTIIALSQLSREVEKRNDKRPQLSDLRESGSIEQDADVVMFVFREEYYVSRAEPPASDIEATVKWQDDLTRCEGLAEVIISKQRHGPTGTVKMQFDGQFTQFSDLAREVRK